VSETPAQTVRVTVARTSKEDVGQRQVIVSIDGGQKRSLVFGESATFELSAGEHVLKANNTLVWKSLPFSAKAGEHVQFDVANRATRFTLGFLSLIGVAPLYLTIEKR
jgi:hypothetical protein